MSALAVAGAVVAGAVVAGAAALLAFVAVAFEFAGSDVAQPTKTIADNKQRRTRILVNISRSWWSGGMEERGNNTRSGP